MYSLGLCAGASTITLVEIKQNGTKSIVNKVLSRMHEGNPEQVINDLLSGVDLASYNSAAIIGRRYKEFIKLPNISEPLAVEYAFKHVNGTGSPYNAIISTGGETFMVYNRTKFVFNKAGIKNASTHTLRKTAGAWYYVATRDIFAASRFLGHSSVKVTEKHYAGLIQSLQVEYSAMYETTLNSRLLLGCYFETKQDQSRPNLPSLPIKENPSFIVDKQGF